MRMKNLLSVLFGNAIALCAIFGSPCVSGAETVTYYYTNEQGTPLATTDAAGNIIASADYRPYGSQTLGSPTQGPGYTGHVNDAGTGLVYMQARYYDPAASRFLSVDPAPVVSGDIYKYSRFVYANNNPLNRIDPDGRDSVGEIIDKNAQAASDQGDGARTYAWAFAGAAWNFLGAEGVSQTFDKGSNAGGGNYLMAAIEEATLGKGSAVAKSIAAVERQLVKDGVKLTAEQAKNIGRFVKKAPANARDSIVAKKLPNGGVAVQATSPGRVPGSAAIYEKQIDGEGKTINMTKTTYDPEGNIVHVKDK